MTNALTFIFTTSAMIETRSLKIQFWREKENDSKEYKFYINIFDYISY